MSETNVPDDGPRLSSSEARELIAVLVDLHEGSDLALDMLQGVDVMDPRLDLIFDAQERAGPLIERFGSWVTARPLPSGPASGQGTG